MTVFANGLEIACKAQSNKVIAAFPYVCMTPPQTPATPPGVPVPYPTFGMDSDTASGTGTVKIGGETVTQKNKSYYTKCKGNEAGCAPKKNLVTSVNTGKEYAHAWSGNVKMDGEPVSRFSDISSNDHASPTAGGPPHPKTAKVSGAVVDDPDCLVGEYDKIVKACSEGKPPGQAHHIVPDKAYRTGTRAQAEAGVSSITRTFGGKDRKIPERVSKAPSLGQGMCICISKSAHEVVHKDERDRLNKLGRKLPKTARTKAQIKAAIQKKKDAGQWGTAKLGDIIDESKKSIDATPKDKNGKPTDACLQKAKDAVDKQTENMKASQIGRTSGNLPNEPAVDRMLR